jgi:hypothetical protein
LAEPVRPSSGFIDELGGLKGAFAYAIRSPAGEFLVMAPSSTAPRLIAVRELDAGKARLGRRGRFQ